jgi:hypothetical protein
MLHKDALYEIEFHPSLLLPITQLTVLLPCEPPRDLLEHRRRQLGRDDDRAVVHLFVVVVLHHVLSFLISFAGAGRQAAARLAAARAGVAVCRPAGSMPPTPLHLEPAAKRPHGARVYVKAAQHPRELGWDKSVRLLVVARATPLPPKTTIRG